jgi:hypothetical protein
MEPMWSAAAWPIAGQSRHDAEGIAQQFDRRCRRVAQALPEHGHHRRHHHPQPAAAARWGVAHRCAQDFVYGIAGGGTGFIHVGHRLLTDDRQQLRATAGMARLTATPSATAPAQAVSG